MRNSKDYIGNYGLKVGCISKFDGDIELLKEKIQVINKMRDEYPLLRKIDITVSVGILDDITFAETLKGKNVKFNTKALRNRMVTNNNIIRGGLISECDIRDIAEHECYHILCENGYGNSGIEYAIETLYNLEKKMYSKEEILDYLYDNFSKTTSMYYGFEEFDKYRKNKLYKEIIPEVALKNKNDPTEFTKVFMELFKKR